MTPYFSKIKLTPILITAFATLILFQNCNSTSTPKEVKLQIEQEDIKLNNSSSTLEFEEIEAQLKQLKIQENKDPSSLTPQEIRYRKAQENTQIDKNFPVYKLVNDKGEFVTDKSYNKGTVLYFFWGTWCSTCIEELNQLKKYKDEGKLKANASFVSISTDKDKKLWKKFLSQYEFDTTLNDNLLLEDSEKEHALYDFLLKEFVRMSAGVLEKEYGTIVPAYVLVEDGKIKSIDTVKPTMPSFSMFLL